MNKLHGLIDAMIGLRKLLFAVIGLTFIAFSAILVLVVFIVNWYLGTDVISGQNLVDLYASGFQYASVIVSAYLAVNVCNKWVAKWMKRK